MVAKEREAHCRTSVADKTARAYRAALKRLSEGQATHPDLVGRPVRIAPATVAREARLSRNPLYSTHREILEEIATAAGQPSSGADLAAVVAGLRMENAELRASLRKYSVEKRQLASENLTLLHRARVAEEKLTSIQSVHATQRA